MRRVVAGANEIAVLSGGRAKLAKSPPRPLVLVAAYHELLINDCLVSLAIDFERLLSGRC